MSLELFSFILLFGGLSLLYVFFPWLDTPKPPLSSLAQKFLNDYQSQVQNREIIMENLKDLELDFRTDKMDARDYDGLRDRLLRSAVSLNEDLKSIESQADFFKWIKQKESEFQNVT